jgi:two-component system, NtrC family, nitrogen regulation sensor histidine kinase NtrY
MGLNNFRANVVLRAVTLAALCFALAWGCLETEWLVTPLVLAALIATSVVELIRYAERTSRDLSNFLHIVASHDVSIPVSVPHKGRAFGQLQEAYRLLTGEFRRLNLQKAANHQYLEALVEHVGVALFCFDEQNAVTLMNGPARRLFGVPYLVSGHSFGRIDPRLPQILQQLADGERTLVNIQHGDDSLRLVLYATTFELLQRRHRIVSFHNIHDELDQQEVESWQKLIRVLTHEIMNSVTPIISLSGLIRENLTEGAEAHAAMRALTAREHEDLVRSVTAIHARSSGLLEFVQAYRSFANLPFPSFADVAVLPLLERIGALMAEEVGTRRIAFAVRCSDAGLRIHVDPHQVEQVLINLLRNAFDALSGRAAARIELRALEDDSGRVAIQVDDNGAGIEEAQLEDIFVPFFTTKREGMGVGLSISRRLMRMNHGSIAVRSVVGEGCVFTLRFRSAKLAAGANDQAATPSLRQRSAAATQNSPLTATAAGTSNTPSANDV